MVDMNFIYLIYIFIYQYNTNMVFDHLFELFFKIHIIIKYYVYLDILYIKLKKLQ